MAGVAYVQFGVLFKDEILEQQLESLVGTLKVIHCLVVLKRKAARKRGVIDFQGQLLLQGAHDNVDIILKKV